MHLGGSQIDVLLLLRQIQEPGDGGNAGALSPAQKQLFVQRLGGASPALTGGWQLADPGTPRRSPGGVEVSARTPTVVTFDVDLSAAPQPSEWVLLALVSATNDAITAPLPGTNVRELVLGSHHAAARVLAVR